MGVALATLLYAPAAEACDCAPPARLVYPSPDLEAPPGGRVIYTHAASATVTATFTLVGGDAIPFAVATLGRDGATVIASLTPSQPLAPGARARVTLEVEGESTLTREWRVGSEDMAPPSVGLSAVIARALTFTELRGPEGPPCLVRESGDRASHVRFVGLEALDANTPAEALLLRLYVGPRGSAKSLVRTTLGPLGESCAPCAGLTLPAGVVCAQVEVEDPSGHSTRSPEVCGDVVARDAKYELATGACEFPPGASTVVVTGVDGTFEPVGCGCGATPGAPSLGLLVLAAWARRRSQLSRSNT